MNQRIGQSVSDNAWINYPAAAASTVSYTANTLNQYTAVGGVTPTYDTNGNLTSDGTYTYGYDTENRLVSASGAGTSAAYTSDVQGRRKTVTTGGTTTVFVTDADNRKVLEHDGASGAIQRWYAGLDRSDDGLEHRHALPVRLPPLRRQRLTRAYSPGFGRFLQTYPVGYGGGINLYAYVGNDPLNLIDPDELSVRQGIANG